MMGCRLEARRFGRTSRSRLLAVAASVGMSVAAGLVTPAVARGATTTPHLETVARGLDNPRGLAFLPNGKLIVAEAGHTGPVCLGPFFCFGLSGRVSAIDMASGNHTALATGLPSAGSAFGAFGLGGVAVRDGQIFTVVGLNPQFLGNPSDDCTGLFNYSDCVKTLTAAQKALGLLIQLNSASSNQGWTSVAGVGAFDFDYSAAHPDPGNPEYLPGDANPFGLSFGPSGGFYVADAASNTVDYITAKGHISVRATLPDPPNHLPVYDAVPTCIARTASGALFIGTETGELWRWNGSQLTEVLSGGKLGVVVGCVADQKGNIYLVNLASKILGSFPNFNLTPSDGSVVKVTPQYATSYVVSPSQGLNYPTGLAFGPDGDLFVATNGLCPTNLSLLAGQGAPPGACPSAGKVVRVDRDDD